MNAFVINENQIKQAGLIAASVVVAVFLAGYFLGSKLNDTTQTASDQSKVMPVSALSPVIDAKTDTQNNVKDKKTTKVEKKKATKDTKKVSKPKSEKKVTADKKARAVKKAKVDNKDKKNQKDKKSAPKKIADSKKAGPKKANSKTINSTNNKVDGGQKKQPATQNSAKTTGAQSSGDIKDSSTSNDKVYSIQAGMFSNEANANSFIEKLAAKKFDAYLSSFVSSSGAVKYNVRVGRFEQRGQARVLLKDFQKSFSSPAYVVISQP